jgi:hypothetical protein
MALVPYTAVRRLARHGFTASLLLFACSCTNVAAVQQFAQASQQVGAGFQPLASEGVESCHRATTFLLSGQSAPDCAFVTSIEPSLLAVNQSLFSYISSLGKLASLEVSHTGSSLQNLGADLKLADPGISDMNLSRANAAAGLASALVNIVASGYQQRKMIAIIEHSNNSVQQVAGFLDEYAAYRYAQQFKDEQSRERAFCAQWTDPAVPEVAREPIAVDLLKRKCAADLRQQTERLIAVQEYQQALRSIANSHQKLYDERHRWNTPELATDLAPAIKELSDAAKAMQKAF